MRDYLQKRLNRGVFVPRPLRIPDREPYFYRGGWANYALGESMIYSFRSTSYTKETFDDTPRIHRYYELLIPLRGEISYVLRDQVVSPSFPSAILIPPGMLHTGLLRQDCLYERHVFYFLPQALSDEHSSLLEKLSQREGVCLQLPACRMQTLQELLRQLRLECEGECDLLLCRALAVQIFALVVRHGKVAAIPESLPPRIVAVRQYLDGHFRTIRSVEEVAQAFFYSREHLARLFKRYYNCSVSSYLIRRRLTEGEAALRAGQSVTRAALECEFESLSAFTCAFRQQYGMTPSAYRKLYSEEGKTT